MNQPRCAAVIPAAGSGSRFGAPHNKLFSLLAGEPLLTHTLRAVAAAGFDQVVLVTQPEEREAMLALARAAGCPVTFADGGATRQQSVAHGLQQVAPEMELVAVHDGARPLATPALFRTALAAAAEHGAAVVAVPAADTVKEVTDGVVSRPLDRSRIWLMQTPQAMRVAWLREAIDHAGATGFDGTDEVSVIEHWGRQVRVVEGSSHNLKVTRPADAELAEALLWARRKAVDGTMRVGYGYDVHQLVEGRELWLGGVRIDHHRGLLGHSDADVLLHAICDALLGAAGLGDIGRHFPDTDPQYRGIASLKLLAATMAKVHAAGYRVGNVDATVIAERPKLAPQVPAMIAAISTTLAVAPAQVNLKATTHEQLGALGAELGIAAHAVALLVTA